MKTILYKFRRFICLLLYYGIARHLPDANDQYIKWLPNVRRFFVKYLFCRIGAKVNIERGANLGMGSDISIGDYRGLGINASVGGPLIIGNNVMMGPDVVILTSNHNIDCTNIPMRLTRK